jgi:hypothetical protein
LYPSSGEAYIKHLRLKWISVWPIILRLMDKLKESIKC